MSVDYFSIYKHTRPLLSFLFAFMLFPFIYFAIFLKLFCSKPADKWRGNSFFTESEMLSLSFIYLPTTYLKQKKVLLREKTDSLQPHTQMRYNELVSGSLVPDYYAKLSECFTYSKWHQMWFTQTVTYGNEYLFFTTIFAKR